jgi:hypothetical protein
METVIHACVSTSGQVRPFDSRDEAQRFVMREGDQSRLWSVEPASDFKTRAVEKALEADSAYETVLSMSKFSRWTRQMCGTCDDTIEAAFAVKMRADKVMQLAFAVDRGQRAPFDLAELLRQDVDFIVQALITAQAFLTNVAILNALAGFEMTAAQWSAAFGGDVACGQGAIPPAIWQRVKDIRRRAEEMRACLA